MEHQKKNSKTLDSFEKLKKLLLTEDQQKIAEIEKELINLRQQLQNKEHFIEMLDPSLASMLENKITDSKDEMAEALAPIMGEAIKKQIHDSKEDVIDALYPVIGSTIKKSIAEAMKNLVKTINEKLDKTFSFVRLKRKIKSKISGVSEAEILLKESMPFQIHQVFFIHKESGILLSHVSGEEEQNNVDEDLLSGMLTAIHGFAGKLFGETDNQDIHQIQYDSYQIQIEMGRYAYLAVVTSGVKNKLFNDSLIQLEQKLHQLFYKSLRDFDGETGKFERAINYFKKFQNSIIAPIENLSEDKGNKNVIWIALVFIIFLCIILYGSFIYFPDKMIEDKIESDMNNLKIEIPELKSGKITYDINSDEITLAGKSDTWINKRYIEQLILSRTEANRIENKISVENEINSSVLMDKLKSSNLDVGVNLKSTLAKLNYIFQEDKLYIEGNVHTLEEKVQVGNIISHLSSVPMIINNCRYDDKDFNESQYLINRIEETAILFEPASSIPKEIELKKLNLLYNWLNEIPFYTLYIYGHADRKGSDTVNKQISKERAEYIQNHLIEMGISAEKLKVEEIGDAMPVASNETVEGRSLNRRVTFSFHPY